MRPQIRVSSDVIRRCLGNGVCSPGPGLPTTKVSAKLAGVFTAREEFGEGVRAPTTFPGEGHYQNERQDEVDNSQQPIPTGKAPISVNFQFTSFPNERVEEEHNSEQLHSKAISQDHQTQEVNFIQRNITVSPIPLNSNDGVKDTVSLTLGGGNGFEHDHNNKGNEVGADHHHGDTNKGIKIQNNKRKDAAASYKSIDGMQTCKSSNSQSAQFNNNATLITKENHLQLDAND